MISADFISKLTERRDIQSPVCFDSGHQTFRGVRSGVIRKIKAIVLRIQRGEASNRIEREQEKRATKLLLAAFGSIFHGHRGGETLVNVLKADDRFGKMLIVARHIWLHDAWLQMRAGEDMGLDSLMDKYITTALDVLNSSVSDGLDKKDSFFNVSDLISIWFGQQLRTSQLSLSKVDTEVDIINMMESLKRLVRDQTYAMVSVLGWKTINRMRARCYTALETGTVEAVFAVRGILARLRRGESSLGKKGKRREVRYTPLSQALERHLHGLCGSTREFLSRQFDTRLAIASQQGLI